MSHPFKENDSIICVHAPEKGIPIKENERYTIKSLFKGSQNSLEEPIPEYENEYGVKLNEVNGYFLANRFKKATT